MAGGSVSRELACGRLEGGRGYSKQAGEWCKETPAPKRRQVKATARPPAHGVRAGKMRPAVGRIPSAGWRKQVAGQPQRATGCWLASGRADEEYTERWKKECG